MKNRKIRKNGFWQRMMAVLLAAVLVLGMVWETAPTSVLAQESVSGNTSEPTEGETEPAEGEKESAEETGSEEQEDPGEIEDEEEKKDPEGQKPGEGAEQEKPQPGDGKEEKPEQGKEEEKGQESVSDNDAPAKLAAWVESAQTAGERTQVMAAGLAAQADNSGDWNGLHWEFDSTSGTLTISGSGEMGERNASSWGWYSYRESIQKVVIASGVTDIGINAFYDHSNLKKVTISDTVKKIKMNAFLGCSSLSSVQIPNSVEEIGVNAFQECGLTSITIPGSVKNVPDSMCDKCSSLENVTIENGVETIGNNVFIECNKLTAITIPGSVTSIGLAFYKCSGLKDVTFEGTDTIPTLHQYCFDLSTTGSLVCPCVTNNTKGLHIPSCRYLDAYLAVGGWSKFAKNIDVSHTLNYTASGEVITQTCSVCGLSATATISTDNAEYTYTGNTIKPAKITYSTNWVGEKPTATAIVYEDNINAGTAAAKLTIGGATAELFITIQRKSLTGSMVKLSAVSFPHTGNAITPEVTVQDGNRALTKDTDYTVSYANNTGIGTASVTVTGKGNYSGTVTKNFEIVESDADKVAAAKTVVETVLANFNATNGTTREEVQAAIDKALSDAGMTDIYTNISTWYTESKATTSHDGTITVWVTVRLQTQAPEKGQTVKTELTIPKLQETHRHENNSVAFTAWTATDSLPTDAGNYYLTKDVTLTDRWTVPSGTTRLCLNGKTVSISSASDKKLPRLITISVSGTLNLYDCQNSGNITGQAEAGIWNEGAFNMYGGKISGNTKANYGGGVRTIGTFQMYGGEISGNSAFYFGGGVYVDRGIFRMYGGKISGNTNDEGGGVSIYEGTFTVGGDAVISGNTNDGAENNVYLKDGQTIELDTGTPLTGSASIGVTTRTAPTEGNPVDITGHNKDDYSQYFTSDNSKYQIVNDSNTVKLILLHQHTPVKKEKVPADCTNTGTGEYWQCEGTNGCNKMFSDQACTNELSTEPVLPALGHSYGSTWEKDENGHWHECSRCQEKKDQAEHTYDDDSDTDCNICGYQRTVHTHSLTRVDAKAATCTADGNSAYYVCGGDDGCGEWFSDAEGTQEITDHNSVVISKTGHSYDTSTWGYQTAEGHAHQCVNCDGHDEVEAHTPGAAATETTSQICTVCGYIMAAAIGHTCSPQPVAKVEPGCTTAGKQAYYHCEGCGKNYEDAEGTTSIADISAWGTIAALGHDWGEWKVTKKATATKPGEKERTCKRCGEKETEPIPATGGGSGGGNQGGGNNSGGGDGGSGGNGGGNDQGSGPDGGNGGNNGSAGGGSGTGSGSGNSGNGSTGATAGKPGTPGASGTGTGQPKVKQEKKGNIQKEVRVEGETTPDAEMATTLPALSDIVLTEAEKQQAAGGTDIRIVLDVKDASAVIGAADKTVVEMALNGSLAKGYTLGQYLDISLYKVVGNRRSDITQTSRKITVVIRVPDSLKNTDLKKARTFAVIRVHDGKAELLTDLDNDKDTITIETDRFSTYAIVYQDTANKDGCTVRVSVENGGNQKAGGGMDDEPETGDATPLELCATLSMIAGFTYLLLYFTDRRHGMTEETKKELVSRLVAWGKRGGRCRRYLALAAIFVLLVYYHSIGKKTCVEWKEIYGE